MLMFVFNALKALIYFEVQGWLFFTPRCAGSGFAFTNDFE